MTLTIEQAQERLFADALACSGEFPVRYADAAPESSTVERAIERAEGLLRAIALVEDTHGDEVDERGAQELALQRVEAKLNLVLEVLSALIRKQTDALPVRPMRWSRHGVEAVVPAADALPDRGFLLIQPVMWLPQLLELPVVLLASQPEGDRQRLWLQFDPQPAPLEAAVERHLFRLHRREIANSRARPAQ